MKKKMFFFIIEICEMIFVCEKGNECVGVVIWGQLEDFDGFIIIDS
jgi:hypothetical protein